MFQRKFSPMVMVKCWKCHKLTRAEQWVRMVPPIFLEFTSLMQLQLDSRRIKFFALLFIYLPFMILDSFKNWVFKQIWYAVLFCVFCFFCVCVCVFFVCVFFFCVCVFFLLLLLLLLLFFFCCLFVVVFLLLFFFVFCLFCFLLGFFVVVVVVVVVCFLFVCFFVLPPC